MTRTDRIAAELKDPSHAALITSPVSRQYSVGFRSSTGVVFITQEKSYFLIDARYYEQAAERADGVEVQLLTDMRKQLWAIIEKHGIKVISIENKTVTVSELEDFRKLFNPLTVDPSGWLSSTIEKMRIVKSPEEIQKIEAAQRIAESALAKLITNIRPGMTEKQVASVLDFYMMDLGADGISFDTIAASGINSACPHAVPTDKPLQNGEFLTLDFGAVVDGYHSDMTRTVVIGKPDDEMTKVYNAVWGAQTDAMKAVHADVTGKLVDSVAKSTLDAWGYEKFFTHGLGHGVGLEVHEGPTVSAKSPFTLHEGMVITIEPGVYIPHRYGVRIEDMVVVTTDGCINLTKAPKTLIYI
ncbi:MAG: aminopeptidase P family protein [Ruminiclostridium sp.]|nr:aminopeptidase P family protein [Ruminiclostridium sp.]